MTWKLLMIAAAATPLAAGAASAEKFDASKIAFDNVTAAVEITTGTGPGIEVAVRQGKDYHQIAVKLDKDVVRLTGERWKDDDEHDCCNTRIRRTFNPRHGRVATTGTPPDGDFFAGYPTVVVTVPKDADVSFVDARMTLNMASITGALDLDACYVWGEAGDAGSAVIGMIAGSRLEMGNVASGLEVDLSGDTDFKAGTSATADIDIAGSGDVILGDIDGMLDVSIAGSGSVRETRLDGPLTVRIAGSGAVLVGAGTVDKLRATIDGSGTVDIGGVTVEPDLRLYGSSEIRLKTLRGALRHVGSGEVYVGGKLVPKTAQ